MWAPSRFLMRLANLHDLEGVQANGGFIQDEHRGLVQQGLGQPQALPEALGQGGHQLARHFLQAAGGHDPADLRRLSRSLHPLGLGGKPQELDHRQVWIEGDVLRQIPQGTPHLQRLLDAVEAVDPGGAGGGG